MNASAEVEAATPGFELATPPPEPDTWLNAIRGLRENPLARAFSLRQGRKSRRALAYWWGVSLLVSCAIVALQWISLMPFVKSGALGSSSVWLRLTYICCTVLWVSWFPRALYHAAANWLSCLNRQQSRAGRQLDAGLAHSKLSDREIVLGIAAATGKPLILPTLMLITFLLANQWGKAYQASGLLYASTPAVQTQLGSGYAELLTQAQLCWSSMTHVLPWYSLAAAMSLILCAALASVNLYLLLLGTGCRNVSPIFNHVEAGLVAGLQALWVFTCAAMQIPWLDYLLSLDHLKAPLLGNMNAGTAAVLLCAGVYCLILLLPRAADNFRGMLASILGVLQNTVAILFRAGGWQYGELTAAKTFAVAALLLSSALSVVNPLLLPRGECFTRFGMTSPENVSIQYGMWLAEFLVILAVQLILLPVLARFALDSVRRYRQAEE